MNRKSLTLVAIALMAIAVAAPDDILLRRELKENSTENYKVSVNGNTVANVPSMGDMDMALKASMNLSLTSAKLDAGSGQLGVSAKISDIQTKVEGAAAQFVEQAMGQMPKEFTLNGKLDARNRLALDETVKGSDLRLMMATGTSLTSSVLFIEFPDKPVKVGDTWQVAAPKNPILGKAPQSLTAKLVGDKEFQGSQVWDITLQGKLTIDANMAELMKAAGGANGGIPDIDMLMKGTMDVSGEAFVDKTTGKTLQMSTTVAQKTSMDLGGQGSVDSNGKFTSLMSLQK